MAAALVAHFCVSAFFWACTIGVVARQKLDACQWWDLVISPCWPCPVLLGLSIASLRLAAKGRRLAWVGIAMVLVISAATFCYDVSTHRSQVRVDIAVSTYEGPVHHYATWWWYNDRWFEYRHMPSGSAP